MSNYLELLINLFNGYIDLTYFFLGKGENIQGEFDAIWIHFLCQTWQKNEISNLFFFNTSLKMSISNIFFSFSTVFTCKFYFQTILCFLALVK